MTDSRSLINLNVKCQAWRSRQTYICGRISSELSGVVDHDVFVIPLIHRTCKNLHPKGTLPKKATYFFDFIILIVFVLGLFMQGSKLQLLLQTTKTLNYLIFEYETSSFTITCLQSLGAFRFTSCKICLLTSL